ncbi:hypothetical protein FF011L_00780 [Roseimaritima multifibrata]|uniref:Uncharacterized protein n=1 Tax=Roseimaritima multifibrata TaxID=1930274 RepID=A0A517M900_9BACT|nr:hypothetical protein FF011L_00780 [Roseimaritima multifibrata]
MTLLDGRVFLRIRAVSESIIDSDAALFLWFLGINFVGWFMHGVHVTACNGLSDDRQDAS